MFSRPCLRLTSLLFCVLSTHSGMADNRTLTHNELLRLAPLSLEELLAIPVVTASRQEESRVQTPAHIVVITREQIRERRYRNLADLMEDLPGVDFMRGTKSSAYNFFSMQGHAGSNKLLILLDGVRIGHPAGGNIPIAENYALFHARQVEVLYGPAAALYGADAVAGVINIVTDRSQSQSESWVSLGGGAFGAREASFMAGLKNPQRITLTIGGHTQRSDRAPLDKYYPSDFPRVDATTFPPLSAVVVPAAQRESYVGDINSQSLYARLDVGDDLNFAYYQNDFRSLTSTGDPPRTALYRDDARWQTRTDTLFGKYRFRPSDTLSAEFLIDYSLQEVDPKSRYINIFTSFQPGYAYMRAERLAIEQNLNWNIDPRHRVQAGLGYQDYTVIEASNLPQPYDTSRAPEKQGLIYPNTTLPIAIHDAKYHNISTYAQIHSRWSESFSTMAGARHDHHSAYGNSLNPRLGAVWHPNRQHYLKLLYGEAFRAPSPEESLNSFGSFDGSVVAGKFVSSPGFRIHNMALEPEDARTLSLTWDWRPRTDVHLVVNGYLSKVRNLIVTLPSPAAVDSIPGATLTTPESKQNAGKSSQHGLDVMAQWRFQSGDRWSGDLWSSYSWVDGMIDEGSGVEWELPYLAKHKYKLGVTLRYLDRMTLSPRLFWVGETTHGRRNTASPPERLKTPSYFVANLHIGWHRPLDSKATLWLDIHNLFDKRYHVAHGAGSRTFFDMPQQPRSWLLSIEYPF